MIQAPVKATRIAPRPAAPAPAAAATPPRVRPKPTGKKPTVLTRTPIPMDRIIAAACAMLCIDAADLGSKTRHARVVKARELITVVARRRTTLSFPEITRALGRPNHSTIHTAYTRFIQLPDEPIELLGISQMPQEWVAELEKAAAIRPRSKGNE